MKYLIAVLLVLMSAVVAQSKEVTLRAQWEAVDDDKLGFTLFYITADDQRIQAVTNIAPNLRETTFTIDLPMGKTWWYIQADYDDTKIFNDMNPLEFRHRGLPPKLLKIFVN